MKDFIVILFGLYLILFIPLSVYLDVKIRKYQFSNCLLNWFLVFSAMFANPGTVVVAFLISSQFFYGLTKFDSGLTTLPRIMLFIVLTIVFSVLRFFVWIYKNKEQINKELLFVYGKKFAFQAPFLLLIPGFFNYWDGEFTIPSISLLLLTMGIGYSFVFTFIKDFIERKIP